jgi:LacI family transcriptional regulator
MSIKLRDIARAANVSEATVSLALNNREGVNAETKKRVREIAREYGYLPNAIARRLSQSKSRTIGLVISDLENPYFGKLAQFVDGNIRKSGYSTVIGISNDEPGLESVMIRNFISSRVDGILIAPTNSQNDDLGYIRQIQDVHDIPLVFITSLYPGVSAPVVMADLEDGTHQLVSYLLNMGHRNIYFLAGKHDIIPTAYRMEGYRKAFQERGLESYDDRLCECMKFNFDEAYNSTSRLLKSSGNIDAIITINDVMALGVLKALLDNGIRIPEDISVAGYDNMIFSSISTIPITTVSQDIELMSGIAVDMLLRRINSENAAPDDNVFIKPKLIIRQSTGISKNFNLQTTSTL